MGWFQPHASRGLTRGCQAVFPSIHESHWCGHDGTVFSSLNIFLTTEHKIATTKKSQWNYRAWWAMNIQLSHLMFQRRLFLISWKQGLFMFAVLYDQMTYFFFSFKKLCVHLDWQMLECFAIPQLIVDGPHPSNPCLRWRKVNKRGKQKASGWSLQDVWAIDPHRSRKGRWLKRGAYIEFRSTVAFTSR